MLVKVCCRCKQEKQVIEFHPWKYGKDGYCSYCKECKKVVGRDSKLKWRYGIGTEDYDKLFQDQQGKCLICERHQSELDKSLRVDHNHETGEIRGLLCDQCNTAIGLFKEDIEIMKKAISYIEVN